MIETKAVPNCGAVAAAIVAHLPGWTLQLRTGADADDNRHYARATREDGAALVFSVSTYPALRLHASGDLPRDYQNREVEPRNYERPRASFDVTREPAKLAREIERRVLAVYLPAFAWAQAEVQRRAGVEKLQRQLADDLAAAIRSDYPVRTWRGERELHASRRVIGLAELDLEVAVPLDWAGAKIEVSLRGRQDYSPAGTLPAADEARNIVAALVALLNLQAPTVADDEEPEP